MLLADDVPVPEGERRLRAVGDPGRDARSVYATFRPNADGTLSVYAKGLDPASAEAWAITEEPAGGSATTPTPPDPERHGLSVLVRILVARTTRIRTKTN